MVSRQIKKQLSLLRTEAKPMREWVHETHHALLGTVRADMQMKKSRKWAVWKEVAGIMISPWRLSPSFSFVLIAVFVFVAGSGMVIKDSIPGDPLFSAKVGFEKAQLFLALSEDGKAEAHVNNVEKRVHELRKIAAKEESSDDKEKRVTEFMREIKGEIQPLKNTIPQIKSIQTVVNIKKTDEYIQTLDVVVSDISKNFKNSEGLKKEVEALKDMIDKTNTETLVVIAAALEHKEPEISQEAEKVITKSEVQNMLEDMLQSTMEDAQKLTPAKAAEIKAEVTAGSGKKEKASAVKSDGKEKGETIVGAEAEKTGESKAEKTQQILEQAQESLKQNNLVDTITNIAEAKNLINEAKEAVK